ncbi:hypothetical protein [Paraclostridium sordellii]|uniref:hypothetical protein n=1 Tax=Paraclostridium sordellii TaxID=1505 RepID=UPI0005E74B86|nr:hypothetical protein [Paeniclostridium sordellii]CEN82842.1 Uncharacterised protein [[Clostridium] sordellii] [Paeniclostridium sordellii]CEO06713.1 Uncharacterised protein [[Clostridium] sordellii] [Paeniclostridium sordellii]CEO21373.1 Uncharacterised protein [[Clostridium] sordellii] [Paeniclostridium sordellii]CEQ13608.1 Uncharacterised protein [[Clostridium] sordellii] [Paeniclostridium sordellii]
MKKIDKEAMEKFAQEKNIDKGKIEDIANGYKDKSEDELMDELIKIGKTLKGKEEVVEKFKTFLDENQRKKVDSIMNKIANAESKEKVNSKKSKKSKADQSKKESSNKKSSKPENNKSSKSHKAEQVNDSKPGKKVKKIIKKVKKSEA